MGLFYMSSRLDMFGRTEKRPLKNISDVAYQLFSQHGLENWSFRFDHAKSRAGMCDYSKKVISISRRYARTASQSQIENTLLHEIAHALVGHSHGHDASWKSKALEIGCDGKRCHNLVFSTPKWKMHCPKGCFSAPRHRRKENLMCGICHSPVLYSSNDV